jgi:hypothetical protein
MARGMQLLLEMADGTEHTVTLDQRDHAAAEAEDLPATSSSRVTRMRFLGWSAGKRAGLLRMPWQQFNESSCVNVDVHPDWTAPAEEDDESADHLDPGRPDQSAAG